VGYEKIRIRFDFTSILMYNKGGRRGWAVFNINTREFFLNTSIKVKAVFVKRLSEAKTFFLY